MAVDPVWINGLDYDGTELRRVQALSVMTNGIALGGRAGIVPGSGSLAVSLAGSTINVAAGTAWVHLTGQGMYGVSLNAGGTATLSAAHATLPRVDLVYLRVWDNAVDASGLNRADVVYLAGTAAASPAAPVPAGTQIYLPLATIAVPASGGGSPSVSQVVPVTVAPGGILPDPAATGYYAGQYRDNGVGLQRWDGTAWSYPVLNGVGSKMFKRKTADTPRATATLSDDPHLTFSVAANATYRVDGALHWTTTDEAQADLNVDWTTPVGATGTYWGWAQPTSEGTTAGPVRTMSTAIDAARTYGADSDAANPGGMLFRAVLITSAAAGTYALQFARTGTAGTLTMLTNSFLELERVA
ncbi:hypothetical protein [Streptomyces liangshanensis]|uniref:hypothetical protein n=1 Tax=Streptomyces liangshanensis TaxID=2717324 RepID=UPI0036D99D6F